MAITNKEIIMAEASMIGFEYNGENLFTYKQWRDRGYQVKKGEKTFLKTGLWKYTVKKNNDGEEEKKCYMVTACLFNDTQVEKIEG